MFERVENEKHVRADVRVTDEMEVGLKKVVRTKSGFPCAVAFTASRNIPYAWLQAIEELRWLLGGEWQDAYMECVCVCMRCVREEEEPRERRDAPIA